MEVEVFEGDGGDLVADEFFEEGERGGSVRCGVVGGDGCEDWGGAVAGWEGDAVEVGGYLRGGVDFAD